MIKSKILFFDSGVGGLTLLHKVLHRYPREDYIYYADSANMPYGDRPKQAVLNYIQKSVDEFKKYDIKALVVSCHTISAVGLDLLQEQMNTPVLGTGFVNKSSEKDFDPRKLLVVGTPLMIANSTPSQIIRGLQEGDEVDMLPMQELVNFSEEFDFDSPSLKRYLKASFAKIDWEDYHTLVIACSHIMYFADRIREMIPAKVDIVNSHEGSVRLLGGLLDHGFANEQPGVQCFLSGQAVDREVLVPYFNYLNSKSFFRY